MHIILTKNHYFGFRSACEAIDALRIFEANARKTYTYNIQVAGDNYWSVSVQIPYGEHLGYLENTNV